MMVKIKNVTECNNAEEFLEKFKLQKKFKEDFGYNSFYDMLDTKDACSDSEVIEFYLEQMDGVFDLIYHENSQSFEIREILR